MTGLGQLTQTLCLVWALFFVTAITFTRCLAIFLLGFMAALTHNFLMLPLEFKVCQVVIKRQLIEFYDIDFSAFMIGMANPTFLLAYFFVFAMKTGFVVKILEYVFMTGTA